MTITVSEFSRLTKTSRHTVYSWIYRQQLPKGVKVAGIGKSRILEVSRQYEDYEKLITT